MINPIYKPKGAALEYADYALNIYTGCPHGCSYCYVPAVLRISKEQFHSDVRPREGIVEAVEKQLAKGKIKDKLIHLCFTCDPYPSGEDSLTTREIIKLIKAFGNHVQILTKNPVKRDFDLLDERDWFGVTISGYDTRKYEPKTKRTIERLGMLIEAKEAGISTWISAEPVLEPSAIFFVLEHVGGYDRIGIGKLNYQPSTVDWKAFGREAEAICQRSGINYKIKDSLRKEMER